MGPESIMAALRGAADPDQTSNASNSAPNYNKMTVPVLRKYLIDRGVSCQSDYRKEVLVKLSQTADELGLPVVKTPDDFDSSLKARLTVGDGIVLTDPNKLPACKWSDNLASLPNIEWPHVMVYLMTTCGWTTEQITKYKSTNGYALKVGNSVNDVAIHKVEDQDYIFLQAKCTRHTSSDKPYLVWLLVDISGKIISVACQCTG